MNKILIANWKANPTTLVQAQELFNFTVSEAAKYPIIKTIICPPFVFIEELAKLLRAASYERKADLGAQNIFWEKSGPFTGEVSTEMLQQFGINHVLIGHSDRRYVIGETDEMINKKIKASLAAGITPVLLIGERYAGDSREDVLADQLSRDLAGLSKEEIKKMLISYEPVWAISTNPGAKPDVPENTLKAIEFIDNFLVKNYKLEAMNYLYGGSINEKNIVNFLKHPEISGAVIGGASLRKEEFGNILRLVSKIQ